MNFMNSMEFYGICWNCLLISGLQKIRLFHSTFSMFFVGQFLSSYFPSLPTGKWVEPSTDRGVVMET